EKFDTRLVGVSSDHVRSTQWFGLSTNFLWQKVGHDDPYGEFIDPAPSHAAAQFSVNAPVQVSAGNPFSLTVAASGADGNPDPSYSGWVSLGLGSAPRGGALSGLASAPIVNGVATFTALSLNQSGDYTFVAGSDGGQFVTLVITVAPANSLSSSP